MPLPGGAAPAGGAVARSPPAKPLARRSHPTRGCSGGLRGLARGGHPAGRARAGACCRGCAGAPRLGLGDPCPQWPPLHCPCVADTAFEAAASHSPRQPGLEKGRKRRAPRAGARTDRRPGRTLQQFALSRRSPPRLGLFAYPMAVANQDSSLSKRMAFA